MKIRIRAISHKGYGLRFFEAERDIYIYVHVIYTGIRINVYEERAQSFVWKNVRHQAVCKNPFKRNEEKGGEKSIGETVGNSKYALLARPCETI